MLSIKSTDDPVIRFAKLSAELYYFLADALVTRLGEEAGKAAIREAMKKFGEKRVCDMKAEASEQGLTLNPQTYFQVRDMPSNGWKSDLQNPLTITECPMFDIWETFGEKGIVLGALYCEIDHTLFNGFGMTLRRPRCKTAGDRVCDFQVESKERATDSGKE